MQGSGKLPTLFSFVDAPKISVSSCTGHIPPEVKYLEGVDVSEENVLSAIGETKCKWSEKLKKPPLGFSEECSTTSAEPLNFLYFGCLDDGRVPPNSSAWIALVHKEGARSGPRSETPVSHTSELQDLGTDNLQRDCGDYGRISSQASSAPTGREGHGSCCCQTSRRTS